MNASQLTILAAAAPTAVFVSMESGECTPLQVEVVECDDDEPVDEELLAQLRASREELRQGRGLSDEEVRGSR